MSHTINDLVNIAIEGWANLIGLDQNGEVRGKHNPWQRWDLEEYTKKLNESRRLDTSGLTTFMMLRGLVERYLQDVQFSAYALLLDPKSIGARGSYSSPTGSRENLASNVRRRVEWRLQRMP